MKRRIVGLLMCLVMVLSLLPTEVWAEVLPKQDAAQQIAAENGGQEDGKESAANTAAPQSGESGVSVQAAAVAEADGKSFSTLQAAFDYAVNEAPGFPTIKLLDNVTLDECIYPDGRVTLDLNGKTVSRAPKEYAMGGNDVSVFCVQGGAALTIQDTVGGGQIVQPNIFAAVTANGGTVTIESGTIKATSTNTTDNRAIEVSSGTVTINDGTIEGAQIGVRVWSGGKLIVNGGAIHGGESYALRVGGGNVQLSGGTFTTNAADGYSIWNEKGTAASLLKSGYAYMTDTGEGSPLSDDEYKVRGKTTVEEIPESVTYIGADGKPAVCSDYEVVTSDTNILSDRWYVVKKKADVYTLYLNGYKSTINLILCDGATLMRQLLRARR